MLLTVIQMVEDEINAIFAEYEKMMRSLTLKILKDTHLAEDAVQESLIKLSKNTKCIDEVKSARSRNFVYTVTKNTAISLLRKNNSGNSVTFEDLSSLRSIEGDVDVKAFCDDYGFTMEIGEALSQLEEIDKDIICYKYGGGYTSREIGKITGLKPANVRKRLERALDKLQKILEDEEMR